jgi:hypothetical protein
MFKIYKRGACGLIRRLRLAIGNLCGRFRLSSRRSVSGASPSNLATTDLFNREFDSFFLNHEPANNFLFISCATFPVISIRAIDRI